MNLSQRKLQRLKGYDYSIPNYYFVTICTQNKLHMFGEANRINELGDIAEAELINIPNHFNAIKIDKYVIMPNHIHAIIVIGCDHSVEHGTKSGVESKTEQSRLFPTLSTIIGLYKSGVSKQIGYPIWQRSFYDRIIRNKQEYKEIWQYIDENPLKWELDCFYMPDN